MFQDFANTLEGAEVEVYYYWFTLLLLSNILLRFLVFLEIFQGDDFLPTLVIGRKVQEEGETINHDISGEENNTRKEKPYLLLHPVAPIKTRIYIKKTPHKSKTTPS